MSRLFIGIFFQRLFVGLQVTTLLLLCLPLSAREFHVAPDGNDAEIGTKKKPFATLVRAQEAVRYLKKQGPLTQSVSVVLHEGTWSLDQSLTFTPNDSGTKEYPITWMAALGEKPVISGGTELSAWQRFDERLWVTHAPIEWKENPPTQMFIEGVRAVRARTPNEGEYFYTKRLQFQGDGVSPCLSFRYDKKDAGPWLDDPNVQIVQYHHWSNSYNRIDQVDHQLGMVKYARPSGAHAGGPNVRYFACNTFDSLDAPNEWYYDREKNQVFYYPRPNENLSQCKVVMARLTSPLLEIQADLEKNEAVEHLVFRGISFQYSGADLSADYLHSVQGAHTQRGAFFAVGLCHSIIEHCEFTHLGEHAISLREGCQNNIIRYNHLHDLGGGGIYLSKEVPKKTEDSWMTAHNLIENNFIHDGGIVFAASCGVFMGGSACHNKILHNEICNMNWVGIHAGWSWSGTNKAFTHHNEIGWNYIHQIGNGVLSDIGGVYFLGISTGTVFHHNRIANVTRFTRGMEGYGGWGIYLDAGSSGIRVENNVVSDTQDGGLHLHCYAYPWGDTIENNIFAFAKNGELMRNSQMESDQGDHAKLTRNIIYQNGEKIYYGGNWNKGSNFNTDYNCIWTTSNELPLFGGRSWDQWQQEGYDTHSLLANPLFVDAEQRDFRLLPDSPALAIGFKPIDMMNIGLQGEADWIALPKSIPLRKVETAISSAAPSEFSDNYEEYQKGEIPDAVVVHDGNSSAVIRVTDEIGASGSRQSLKFVDEPGLQWLHDPHLFYSIAYEAGIITSSFEMKLENEAVIQNEWRDYQSGSGYKSGPTFRIDANGDLSACGRKLTNIPRDQWVKYEIVCRTRKKVDNKWSLKVEVPGRPVECFEELAFGPGFQYLNWLGFISLANTNAVLYLDNFRTHRQPEKE